MSTSTAHRHINVVPPLTPLGVARLLPCLAHPLPSTSSLWHAGAVAGKQLDPHSARLLGHASHVSSELQRAVPSAPRVPRGHAACTAKPRAKTAALADAGSKAAHVTLEVSAATCLSSSPALAATAFRPSSHPARIPAELCLTLLLCPSAAFSSIQLYHNFRRHVIIAWMVMVHSNNMTQHQHYTSAVSTAYPPCATCNRSLVGAVFSSYGCTVLRFL